MKKTILTGIRPTGRIHLGHYFGAVRNWATLQDDYNSYFEIADVQALTDNFDNPKEKNLLFTGNTGLGKTFMSNCIANEMLKRNKTVLYQTAPIMLDSIIDYKLGKSSNFNVLKNLLSVDLLVIDDLGTESLNNMKFSELFTLINTRLLNQNNKATKTIISTNLSLDNLASTYGERIISRLIGSYNICYFFGDDIRIKKR